MAVVKLPVSDPPAKGSEMPLIKLDVVTTRPSVMLPELMVVVFAATAMVASKIELDGVDGGVGDALAVPAMTARATVFVDPE